MSKEAVNKIPQKVIVGQGRDDGRGSGGRRDLTFDHKAAGKVWKAALSSRSSQRIKQHRFHAGTEMMVDTECRNGNFASVFGDPEGISPHFSSKS